MQTKNVVHKYLKTTRVFSILEKRLLLHFLKKKAADSSPCHSSLCLTASYSPFSLFNQEEEGDRLEAEFIKGQTLQSSP